MYEEGIAIAVSHSLFMPLAFRSLITNFHHCSQLAIKTNPRIYFKLKWTYKFVF